MRRMSQRPRDTQENARSINERLKRHENLSEAVGIVYKNRYYLAVDNVCYIADSRYKYTSEDSVDGSYNYEWWFWDNVPVRVGRISETNYTSEAPTVKSVCLTMNTPIEPTNKAQPETSLDISDNKITYNQNIDIALSEGDRITFSTNGIYARFDSVVVEKTVESKPPRTRYSPSTTEWEVYADNVGR